MMKNINCKYESFDVFNPFKKKQKNLSQLLKYPKKQSCGSYIEPFHQEKCLANGYWVHDDIRANI